ncbi:MoaD/ThiS family protein [Sinimarinibacterium flocculans]|uniref:Molybdopterin synthase sulfur carrier subunit n=1 Tax=Sinimarinibacterium flocculans TaxID=985250 RepID=A0A318EBY8_9GAMM|nr:MoaD/ThiS family protein [Sinimarinibacterium flocculans]PXV64989.1 molybdopterin synthase sulfur carrier subunit [Sinimarinibacterium flocculans]
MAGSRIEVRVQCFGPARRLAGDEWLSVQLGEPATVADALAALAQRGDDFAALLKQCAVALGDEIVRRTYPLKAGDEIALLPPVAGG